jgi:hypothetical protein
MEHKILSSDETYEIMKRFPKFELSYETIPHKKVSHKYNICLTIFQGKKGYIWFSYYGEYDVCFFMEMNREKKIYKMKIVDIEFNFKLSLGTILYGTFIELEGKKPIFVVEDILFYEGISMKNILFENKLGFLERFFKKDIRSQTNNEIIMCLPIMWFISEKYDYECKYIMPEMCKNLNTNFNIHHIQYRCLSETLPYMNVFNQNVFTNLNTKKEIVYKPIQNTKMIVENFNKPQFKMPTVFLVSADIQFDIYHLFVYGKESKQIYYNIAYIPNYKTSVFMNKIFRKIRENDNLDYIEESEDEEDFENMDEDKYVDLQKTVSMECLFSYKYKKWVPKKIVYGQKIVHISQLTNHY